MKKSNLIVDKSMGFAVRIVNLYKYLTKEKSEYVLSKQLLRSGTSIGANVHEANYASSKSDFVNKFQIALKECYETDYWLDIFHDSMIVSDDEYSEMISQCSKIRKLLIASINTAKKSLQ